MKSVRLERSGSSKWFVAGLRTARQKVGHALRDASSNRVKCMTFMNRIITEASQAGETDLLRPMGALREISATNLKGKKFPDCFKSVMARNHRRATNNKAAEKAGGILKADNAAVAEATESDVEAHSDVVQSDGGQTMVSNHDGSSDSSCSSLIDSSLFSLSSDESEGSTVGREEWEMALAQLREVGLEVATSLDQQPSPSQPKMRFSDRNTSEIEAFSDSVQLQHPAHSFIQQKSIDKKCEASVETGFLLPNAEEEDYEIELFGEGMFDFGSEAGSVDDHSANSHLAHDGAGAGEQDETSFLGEPLLDFDSEAFLAEDLEPQAFCAADVKEKFAL